MAARSSVAPFARYVAIGDSSTEGLDDPDGRGHYRGWANRLAERIAATQDGGLDYANLGVRGLKTRAIRERQLDRAVAMRPDLATIFAGTNDAISREFDADAVAADIEHIEVSLIEAGATVLTFTLPDLLPVMPITRLPGLRGIGHRVRALNALLRDVAARTGAILVDFEAHPTASDPRLWSDDRLHANAAGHARIAAALAHALGLPGTDDSWMEPLPPPPRLRLSTRILDELRWGTRHLVPWIVRHAQGKSSGDGIVAKRPTLEPVEPRVSIDERSRWCRPNPDAPPSYLEP